MDDAGLIQRVKQISNELDEDGMTLIEYQLSECNQSLDIFKKSLDHSDLFVAAGDTLFELGHPLTDSICLGLLTENSKLVEDGKVTIIGGELHDLQPGRYSFALIVLTVANDLSQACRYALARKMSVGNDLVGCMTKVMSDRIWIRFSKNSIARGLSLGAMGFHIISEINKSKNDFYKVEVIMIITQKEEINKLKPIADIYKARKEKRYIEQMGEITNCDNLLDCTHCQDNIVCQVFKDVITTIKNNERLEGNEK